MTRSAGGDDPRVRCLAPIGWRAMAAMCRTPRASSWRATSTWRARTCGSFAAGRATTTASASARHGQVHRPLPARPDRCARGRRRLRRRAARPRPGVPECLLPRQAPRISSEELPSRGVSLKTPSRRRTTTRPCSPAQNHNQKSQARSLLDRCTTPHMAETGAFAQEREPGQAVLQSRRAAAGASTGSGAILCGCCVRDLSGMVRNGLRAAHQVRGGLT